MGEGVRAGTPRADVLLAGRGRPLRVAVLVSATGANLSTLGQLQADRPEVLEIVLVVSDRKAPPAFDIARALGLPVWPGTFAADCGSWTACRDDHEREEYRTRSRLYHDRLTDRMERFEAETGEIDLVVLAYHRWITGRFLERYRDRVINQHPGDLTVLTDTGRRALIGLDPVGDALRQGRGRTRTSTFLVDESQDGGAVLAQGPPVTYSGPWPPSAEDVQQHEAAQKIVSDRPALRATMIALSAGRFSVDHTARHADDSPVVGIDGVPTALGGLILDRNPMTLQENR